MTFLELALLKEPTDFKDWYSRSSEYVEVVAEEMGFETNGYGELRRNAIDALADNRTDVDADVASTIAATLIGDADFGEAMAGWLPRWYYLATLPQAKLVDQRAANVGKRYAEQLDDFESPVFREAEAVTVNGRPAVEACDSFQQQFVLTDAILHVDWFVYVAEDAGITVPDELQSRTLEQSAGFFAGATSTIDDDVRRFQQLLFSDIDWVRGLNEDYDLNSKLFKFWTRSLSPAFEWLDATTSPPAKT